MISHDMEDLIAVLDGRPELVEEIRNAPEELKHHLAGRISVMLEDNDFMQALPGHLPTDLASQERVPMLTERLKEIARMDWEN